MPAVGLDFGTSNSSIARLNAGRVELFELDSGSLNPHMLRSFIFIDRAQHTFVGSDAVAMYQKLETGRPVFWENVNMGQVQMVVGSGGSSPIIYWDDLMVQIDTAARGRLMQSVKTALRNPDYEGTQVFDRYYTVEELIAILLSALRLGCERAIDGDVDTAVIGRPVKFSDDEQVDRRAQSKIEKAAEIAGFKKVRFVFEPVAAAHVYHRSTEERQAALVFDFGGGTLDLTVMELGGSEQPVVLATKGVLLGGDDIDRSLMRSIKRHFGEGARLRNRQPVPAHIFGMLDNWQTMVLLSRPEYRSVLKDAARGNNPEAIARLTALVNQNMGFALFQGIEKAKIDLSFAATAMIELEREGFRFKDLVTRPQLEGQIRQMVAEISQEIDRILLESDLQPEQIQVVLRTGGTSEMPAFIRLLTEKFGYDRLRPLNPFETIVGGLAIIAGEL